MKFPDYRLLVSNCWISLGCRSRRSGALPYLGYMYEILRFLLLDRLLLYLADTDSPFVYRLKRLENLGIGGGVPLF